MADNGDVKVVVAPAPQQPVPAAVPVKSEGVPVPAQPPVAAGAAKIPGNRNGTPKLKRAKPDTAVITQEGTKVAKRPLVVFDAAAPIVLLRLVCPQDRIGSVIGKVRRAWSLTGPCCVGSQVVVLPVSLLEYLRWLLIPSVAAVFVGRYRALSCIAADPVSFYRVAR